MEQGLCSVCDIKSCSATLHSALLPPCQSAWCCGDMHVHHHFQPLLHTGEWWDPSDRQRWATQRRMVRAPHPEEGEQPDAEQGTFFVASLHVFGSYCSSMLMQSCWHISFCGSLQQSCRRVCKCSICPVLPFYYSHVFVSPL